MTSEKNRHIIKKQILEVYTDQEQADIARERLRLFFQKQLLPAINEICDQLSPAGAIHAIPRIEINLDDLNLNTDNPQLLQQFKVHFHRTLSKTIREIERKTKVVTEAHIREKTVFNLKGKNQRDFSRQLKGFEVKEEEASKIPPKDPPATSPQTEKANEKTLENYLKAEKENRDYPKSTLTRNIEFLRHVLRTGLLPWWADPRNDTLLADAVRVLLQLPEEQLRQAVSSLLKDEIPRKRLIRMLNSSQFIQLSSVYCQLGEVQKAVSEWEELIPDTALQWEISPSRWRFQSREALLFYLKSVSPIRQEVTGILEVLLQHAALLSENEGISAAGLRQIIEKRLTETAILRKTVEGMLQQKSIHPEPEKPLVEEIPLSPQSEEILGAIAEWQFILPHIAWNSKLNTAPIWKQSRKALSHYLKTTPSSEQNAKNVLKILLLRSLPQFSQSATALPKLSRIIREELPETAILRKEIKKLSERAYNRQQAKQAGKTRKHLLNPSNKSFDQSDEIYLNNSGLVILAPFLPRFFENLEWLDGPGFKNSSLQHQAALLLQYLVDRSIEAPESLLPFNKLLCGLLIEDLIEIQEPMVAKEQEMGEELLTAVITHAPILRDMSVDAFRNTFLRREGILIDHGAYWLLRVQRNAYDIVLDRFPWSFNIVKLPWIEKAIYVNW